MSFWDETAKLLGIDTFASENTFCYVCPSKGMVVEGYKKIYELSQSKITLLCEQGKKIDVFGTRLEIKEISHRELSINGIITAVNFS